MKKKRLKPFYSLHGLVIGVKKNRFGPDPYIIKDNPKTYKYVFGGEFIEPIIGGDPRKAIPIITRNHSLRRCPYCQKPECVQNKINGVWLYVRYIDKQYFFSLFECLDQRKFFLIDDLMRLFGTRIMKEFVCRICKSKNIDILGSCGIKITDACKYKEIRNIGHQISPDTKEVIKYSCYHCGAKEIIGITKNKDGTIDISQVYSNNTGVVKIEDALRLEKGDYEIIPKGGIYNKNRVK